MPRRARAIQAKGIYHVLNRGNGRMLLFHKPADYQAFERVLTEGLQRYRMQLLAYCLMPNHWHLVLCPPTDRALGRFMGWVGVTHVRRHHEHYHTRGGGHLYQGRFKSFPVQDDAHFLTLCRYVEANALRANLVECAQDWPFCSAGPRPNDDGRPPLSPWPVGRPKDWIAIVNRAIEDEQLDDLRTSVNRGRPFGEVPWVTLTTRRLGLEHTLRRPGRPTKNRSPQPQNQ